MFAVGVRIRSIIVRCTVYSSYLCEISRTFRDAAEGKVDMAKRVTYA